MFFHSLHPLEFLLLGVSFSRVTNADCNALLPSHARAMRIDYNTSITDLESVHAPDNYIIVFTDKYIWIID
jgi:hypothetical protein